MPDRNSKTHPVQPAQGERAAKGGYFPQDRCSAALLLACLEQSDFESVRIADPTAGTIDDFQIFTRGRLDAYQFKWNRFPRNFTPSDLFSKQKGKSALLATLADGWRERVESFPPRRINIHLVTNGIASDEKMVNELKGDELGKRSLAAFIEDSWNSVHMGEKRIPREGEAWSHTWNRIREATEFSDDILQEFVKSFHFKFSHRLAPPEGFSDREKEAWEEAVRYFTERLYAVPNNPSPIITLNYPELQEWFGIRSLAPPRQLHEFRLDPNARKPLRKTAEQLDNSLEHFSNGYICVSGSPGAGKSSTLTLVLRRSPERVIRYYAYTPDSPNDNQGESAIFYSRLVDELKREQFHYKGNAPHRGDFSLLKSRFKEQMRELAHDFAKTGKKTIILIDGLDHIEREQSPNRSLLEDLPSPSEIPNGVILLLGTQTQRLLRSDIVQSLRETGRSIETSRMEDWEVERILKASKSGKILSRHNLEEAIGLVAGHPLALGYLIRKLDDCDTPDNITLVFRSEKVFEGNILASYRSYWDDLGSTGFKVKQLLGYFARLRRPAEFDWLSQWADPEALDILQTKFYHYFERSKSSYQFFHNSFRIFVLDSTCENPDSSTNASIDQRYHQELADFCASSEIGSIWHAEQFHHLAESNQISKALEIATPQWFRTQFLAMRAQTEIFKDLHRAQILAASTRSGLHICRLALACREIDSRFTALELDSERLIKILLKSGQSTEAIRLIRTDKRLLIRHEFGLKICNLLRATGEEGEAKNVFELINPNRIDAQSPGDNFISAQRRMLVQWALTSLHYLPLNETLSVLNSCVFKAGNTWSGGVENQQEPDQAQERAKTVADFTISARNCGFFEIAENLELLVDWTTLPETCQLEHILSKLHLQIDGDESSPSAIGDFSDLKPELLELIPHATKWQKYVTLEYLIRLGELESAGVIFSKIDPSEIALRIGRAIGSNEPEIIARKWLTVALALGEEDLARSLFIDPSINGQVSAKLADSNLSVGKLHAESWTKDKARKFPVATHFDQILAPLSIPFPSADDWSEVRRSMPGILDNLVAACQAIGQAAITALSDFLSSHWEHTTNRRSWPLYFQRQILTEMGKIGADPAWLAGWLSVCEDDIEVASTSGSRTSEYFDQAEAWLACGEKSRAVNCAQRAFELSLGVGYNEGYQLFDWILFLRHSWKENIKGSLNLIAHIARSSISLLHETNGSAMGESAQLLVEECFHIEPVLGVKLWEYFDQQSAISFPHTLAGILRHSPNRPDEEDPQTAFLILCEILVPILDESKPDLVVGLLGRLFHSHGIAKAQIGVEQLATRIATFSKMEHRANWWRGLSRGCKEFGLTLPSLPVVTASCDSIDEKTEEAVAKIIESDDPISILENILETQRIREASSNPSSHLDVRRVVGILAASIKPCQIERCRKLLGHKSYVSTAMVETLATRVSEPSVRSHLWKWSEELYRSKHDEENGYPLIESEIRPVFVGLLAADSSKGLDYLFESLRNHRWLSPASFDKLTRNLISSPTEFHGFSIEVSEFLESMLLGLADNAPPLELADLKELHTVPGSGALMRLVFQWLDHPSGVLRHGARRVFSQLCLSGNPSWKAELNYQLNIAVEAPVILQLLENVEVSLLKPISNSVLEALPKLSRSRDFESRGLAATLLSKLGKEAPDRAVVDQLHSTYRFKLPPSRLELNEIARYMGDFVSTCSLVTGIPKANLYQRVNEVSTELQHSGESDSRLLSRHLADTNLYFGFRMPEMKVGRRVAFRILAELQDAGFVPTKEVSSLLRIFSGQDDYFSNVVPDVRPAAIPYPTSDQHTKAWSEEWLEQIEENSLSTPPVENNGWFVIGYRHSISVHTDHRPTESHLGLLSLIDLQNTPDELDYESTFYDRNQPGHSTEYHSWSEKEDDRSLFVLGGQSKDLPCPPWLAIHPGRARELGWIADETSLFGWKDSAGKKTSYSKWWADGPHQYTSNHGNQITAAGWITVVSPEALRAIEIEFGATEFYSVSKRHRAG